MLKLRHALLTTLLAAPLMAQSAPGKNTVLAQNDSIELEAEDEQKAEDEADVKIEKSDDTVPLQSEESPAPSRKIFDWEKYRNQKTVPHPFAEKGLIRINRQRHYFYRLDPSEQKSAASVRFGAFYPSNLENPDQSGQAGATFDENYDQTSNPMLIFDYEWQIWRIPLGKLGLKAGTGLYLAQGNGHFVSGTNAGLVPRERFTLAAIPLNFGAIYRFHFGKDKQLFVPYGEGGASVIGFAETRDDGKSPKFGGSPAAYFAGGLAIDMTYFDYMSRVQLDREYGINAVYLALEYRGIVTLSQKYDFSSDLVNAGFTVEF